MVHTPENKKVVIQGLDGYIIAEKDNTLLICKLTEEQRIKEFSQMAERGIATNVHYKPLPMMTTYKALGFDIANYPNAYNLFVNEVTLPLNTKMTDEDLDYVIENFIEIVKAL